MHSFTLRRSRALALAALLVLPAAATADAHRDDGALDADQRYAYTCGHLGVPCHDMEAAPRLRVQLQPARVAADRRVRLRMRVLGVGRHRRAFVSIDGRRAVTRPGGRIVLSARFSRPGRRKVVARASGATPGRAWLAVTRRH